MIGRRCAAGLLAVLLLGACSGQQTPPAPPPPPAAAGTIANPVLGRGADPFVTVVDKTYHYVQSATDGSGVTVRSSASLAALQAAPKKQIIRGGTHGAPCCEYWAPEVHRIGSRWYVYVAADDGNNAHHRMYVFSAAAITGPYAFDGELRLPGDRWAIDATVLTTGGRSYVLWSGWPGATNGEQDIYLARLASPTRAEGAGVRLSRPELDWETHAGSVGVRVNEAPSVLTSGSRVFVTYSASGCWTPDYALGMLSADLGSDLLDPASWRKSPAPVLAPGGDSGLYGTGHNGFFSSRDGSQTWLVYHAVTSPDGSCGADREVYAQPITFAADGTPELGTPSAAPVPVPAGDPDR